MLILIFHKFSNLVKMAPFVDFCRIRRTAERLKTAEKYLYLDPFSSRSLYGRTTYSNRILGTE